jgi:hypothetical protein
MNHEQVAASHPSNFSMVTYQESALNAWDLQGMLSAIQSFHCPKWFSVHVHRGKGRPRATFVDNLLIDTAVETTGELETLMLDRMVWRRVIQDPLVAPADPP